MAVAMRGAHKSAAMQIFAARNRDKDRLYGQVNATHTYTQAPSRPSLVEAWGGVNPLCPLPLWPHQTYDR
jgi:hypothetical protein